MQIRVNDGDTFQAGRPTYRIWRRKTMDGPITASQLKDKSLFQDNSGSAVPARNVCHNCSKLKVWKGAFITYFPWKPENDNMKFYQNSVSFV